MIESGDIGDVEGADAVAADGTVLGAVRRVYRDDDTGRLEWAVVSTAEGDRFVPLQEAQLAGGSLRVPYAPAEVASAPEVDADAGHVSRGQEADLYLHYGIDYDVSRLLQDRTTGLGAGGDPIGSGPGGDVAGADELDHTSRTGDQR
jgi:hypothetical protein